jgi:hypothetical protein
MLDQYPETNRNIRSLEREKLARALRETAGSLRGQYPEWESPEMVSEWVAARRREDDEWLERRLSGRVQ